MSDLICTASQVRNILINEGIDGTLDSEIDFESKRIPFIHDFPNNCCEHASYLLGATLKEVYPHENISLLAGKYLNQTHYWLSTDQLIIDITINQFFLYKNPVYAQKTESIKELILENSTEINVAFSNWDQANKAQWLAFIKSKLTENKV